MRAPASFYRRHKRVEASALKPQSSTLNPQPSTLNPQHSTLNPQPSTLNPKPSLGSWDELLEFRRDTPLNFEFCREQEIKRNTDEEVVNRLDISTKRILQQNRRLAEDLKLHVQETADLQAQLDRFVPQNQGVNLGIDR